ncbi:MAG: DHA2 family efflux MFS transporter permease subunit [Thermodesulfovibrionales bacterium]|nr:DHA2 family efflux MFS transporter permease subunit [Thermodesulfovibrionales bacterium]
MNKWLITITVMLPTLIEIIDTSVVNVSLDHIRGSLSAGIEESTWTITSYLVSNAIIIPMTGWLSRRFGRKRYLIFSIFLFTLSSFLCGSAWSLESLVFFRVLQGIGGGALQPLSQSILLETFPPHQHGTAMAAFGIGIMFGPIVGPLLGGWITDNWSWRWIFYINIPIGLISILMTLIFIKDPPYMKGMRLRIDYWGIMFLALGLGSLQIVLDKGQSENWFDSRFITTLTTVSFVSLVIFVIVESFTKHPVVNLKIFKNLSFSAGNIVMFFAFFNLFGSIVLLPIYLQTLMGYTATKAGLVLGPGGLATLIAMPVAGKLVHRMNPKILLGAGILICSYATHLMSKFNLQADFWSIIWPRIVLGIGMPFIFIPLTILTMAGIKKEEMGNATGIYNLLRNLGGSFGVAFVTTMLQRRAQFHQYRLVENLTVFDPQFQIASENLSNIFELKGFGPLSEYSGLATIYRELLRQSSMLGFNDAFHLLSLMMIGVFLLIFLLKRKTQSPFPDGSRR